MGFLSAEEGEDRSLLIVLWPWISYYSFKTFCSEDWPCSRPAGLWPGSALPEDKAGSLFPASGCWHRVISTSQNHLRPSHFLEILLIFLVLSKISLEKVHGGRKLEVGIVLSCFLSTLLAAEELLFWQHWSHWYPCPKGKVTLQCSVSLLGFVDPPCSEEGTDFGIQSGCVALMKLLSKSFHF